MTTKRKPVKRRLPEAFNDDDCRRWEAFDTFRMSPEGRRVAETASPSATYKYFVAGYRAGKDAK